MVPAASVSQQASATQQNSKTNLMTEPSAYEQTVMVAERLLTPLVERMRPGAASIPLEGPASDHSEIADMLESFARPC